MLLLQRIHTHMSIAFTFGVVVGFFLSHNSSWNFDSDVARHEFGRRREHSFEGFTKDGCTEDPIFLDGKDKDLNVVAVTSGRGRGKNLRILFDNAASLLKYENPLPPLAPRIDLVKERFVVIPKELLDFESFEPQFMKTWELLRGFLTECQRKGQYPLHNQMIPIEDYCVAYSFIRHYEPKVVIEVGSGYSTRAVYNALRANEAGGTPPAKQVCIEPYRSSVIGQDMQTNISIIKEIVQLVPETEFDQLGSGDVLYIDSSHVSQPFGDTILELAFILPRLREGVIVHVHDIFLPYNYPNNWIYIRPFTEQYLLALFLHRNDQWEILWSNFYMGVRFPHVYKEAGFSGDGHGASIWLRKKTK